MNRRLCMVLGFALCSSLAFAQAPTYQIAVSPYANVGPDKSGDYIGFQIAEFLSSAMAGFPGVQVIERTQIMKILEEQELQLSGITEGANSVSIGQILNAKQMVVGSFELSKTRLIINGRIVDVQSGAVLARASIETPIADSYVEAYKVFMFKLLSELPEYKLTIGVEARIANIKEQATAGADDYAKALAALYNKDDMAALDYLQKAMGASQVGFVGFGGAADRYVETLSRVKGSSRYAKMVQKQIETNKALMEQVEPLSIYRATLKLLEMRTKALLSPDAFVMSGDPAAAVEYDDGLVSTKVRLPGVAGIELKDSAKAALASLFSLQDVVKLGKTALVFAPAPSGKLLGKSITDHDFNLSMTVSIAHAIQFLSTRGDILYELVSEPVPVVSLGSSSAVFSSTAPAVYRATSYRDGWAVHADGTIEIQARALADLDSVRYVIRPDSISFESSFGLGSDLRWRSLITHAYRKYSIKVASEAADPAPQFKDVVITDSFFTTADPELGRVPLLPRNDRVSGFAHLTGVVYFADNAKDAITATWSGAVNGESKPFVGELGPNTVLYFESPSSDAINYGALEFTARLGQSPSGKTVTATLTNGSSWYTGNSVSSFLLEDNMVYTTDGEGYEGKNGLKSWTSRESGTEIFHVGDAIVLLQERGISFIDAGTGVLRQKVEFNFNSINAAALVSGKIYVQSRYGLQAFDATSGARLWGIDDTASSGFAVVFGRVYNSSGAVYDANTGTKLFGTEGRGAVAVTGDRAIWANGLCADRETGKTIWKFFNANKRSSWYSSDTQGSPIIAADTVYFGTNAAVRGKDGISIWIAKDGMDYALLRDGRLFGWDSRGLAACDPATGNRLWYVDISPYSMRPRGFKYRDGSLFVSLGNAGFTRLDLSVFERELNPTDLARRARLGIYSQAFESDSSDTKSLRVTNIFVGEAAEAAGILPGDYIKNLNGHSVASPEQLSDCLYQLTKGDRVTIGIDRFDASTGKWSPLSVAVVLGGIDVTGKPSVARPGFTVRVISERELMALKLDFFRKEALVIDAVLPDSPAAAAGLQPGDLLALIGVVDLQRDYSASDTYETLSRAIAAAMRARTTLNLTVYRDGVRKILPAFKP